MSVLIKGISMPKETWDCPCHDGETGWCKVTKNSCDQIPKDCPLVEVPTPHGRRMNGFIPFTRIDEVNVLVNINRVDVIIPLLGINEKEGTRISFNNGYVDVKETLERIKATIESGVDE